MKRTDKPRGWSAPLRYHHPPALAATVLSVAALAGCGGASSGTGAGAQPAPAAQKPAVTSKAAAPRPAASAADKLTANRKQAGRVLDGDIERTLGDLKGIPVVVKQWASWCPQCQHEFPYFQKLADTYASKVAFVGLVARDSRSDAQAYSTDNALKFPSIFDSDGSQSLAIGAGRSWPTTVIFNASGKRTAVRPGAFATVDELDRYIRDYALAG